MENKPAVIILSAGFSSRMGLFKPLLPFAGQTAIERVLDEVRKAGNDNIVVVTGHEREKIEALILEKGARPCFNEHYAEGMFTSVQRGIREIFGEGIGNKKSQACLLPCGFFLHPVDCPLIPATVYTEMIREIEKHPDDFAVACFGGKKGHPLYVPGSFVPEILAHTGEQGMKFFTKKYDDRIRKIEVNNPEILWDMDELADYQSMCLYLETKNVEKAASARKIHLIRHGEIKQHDAPIFLGQTDVPLSEKGKKQAQEAGKRLLALSPNLSALYSSDLARAKETASQIIERYENLSLHEEKGLREITLGDWDGRLIEEIKETYPEEFRKRGEDILRYKVSGGGENFFELQERSVRCLSEIIKKTDGEIAIVTHSGVIRMIIAHLLHLPIEQVIKMKIANGEIVSLLWTPQSHS